MNQIQAAVDFNNINTHSNYPEHSTWAAQSPNQSPNNGNNNLLVYPEHSTWAAQSPNQSPNNDYNDLSVSMPHLFQCQYPLPYGTPDFNYYKDQFYQNLGQGYETVIDITRIDAIVNPVLLFRYDRKKQEMWRAGEVVENIVFHTGAMSRSERDHIARFNFTPLHFYQDLSSVAHQRPKVCFTRNVVDSLHRSKHILYMVKVLQSKIYLDSGLPIPGNVDTTFDLSGKYVMKFNIDEYYPLCAVYYNINEHNF